MRFTSSFWRNLTETPRYTIAALYFLFLYSAAFASSPAFSGEDRQFEFINSPASSGEARQIDFSGQVAGVTLRIEHDEGMKAGGSIHLKLILENHSDEERSLVIFGSLIYGLQTWGTNGEVLIPFARSLWDGDPTYQDPGLFGRLRSWEMEPGKSFTASSISLFLPDIPEEHKEIFIQGALKLKTPNLTMFSNPIKVVVDEKDRTYGMLMLEVRRQHKEKQAKALLEASVDKDGAPPSREETIP